VLAEIRTTLAIILPLNFSAGGNILTDSCIGTYFDNVVALKVKYAILLWRQTQ
jgi:hypothetical protein